MRRSQAERIRSTRRTVVTATLHSLAVNGYQATTFEKISSASGVSRGGLLHHFPDKTELLAGVFEQAVDDEFENALHSAVELPQGPTRIESALDLLYGLFQSELFQASLAAQVAARVDDRLAERLHPIFSGVYDKIEKMAPLLFGDAVAKQVDLPMRIRFVISGIRGVAILDSTGPSGHHDHDTWEYIRVRLAADLCRGTSPMPNPM